MARKKNYLRIHDKNYRNPFDKFKRREKNTIFVTESQQESKRNLRSEGTDMDNFFNERKKRDLEKMDYSYSLNKVNENWKKVHTKNCMPKRSELKVEDAFDTAKNELFGQPKVSVHNTAKEATVQRSSMLKVLNDVSKLESVLKDAVNNDIMEDLIHELHFHATRNNATCVSKVIEILREEHLLFLRAKGQDGIRLQTIVFFNVISKTFSLSQYNHPVITPALIFMADILSSKFSYSFSNIVARLFIIDIILCCISTAKSFIPEALEFLKSVLKLSLPEIEKKCFDLVIRERTLSDDIPVLQLHPVDETSTVESKKVAVIFTITRQVYQFATLYKNYPLFKVIFEPFLVIFSSLPLHLYPVKLQAKIKDLMEFLELVNLPPLCPLSFPIVRPTPLKTFQPAFECKYEPLDALECELKKSKSKRQKLLQTLKKKVKREERDTLRDIRKSAKVAAFIKLKERQEQDIDRKLKMKNILNELAVQENEFKKLMKKK